MDHVLDRRCLRHLHRRLRLLALDLAVGGGARDRDRDSVDPPGVVAITHDGGATWSPGTLPQFPDLFPPLTCVDTSHCFTLGQFVAVRFQGGSWMDASDLLASADGGRTWAVRRLPAKVSDPQLAGLACPSDSTCYATGSEQQVSGGGNGGSPIVVITHDSGVTWSRVAFTPPSALPPGMSPGDYGESFLSVGMIQCPRLDSCVALGITPQGSKSTPVYSTRGMP